VRHASACMRRHQAIAMNPVRQRATAGVSLRVVRRHQPWVAPTRGYQSVRFSHASQFIRVPAVTALPEAGASQAAKLDHGTTPSHTSCTGRNEARVRKRG
jgi:hypothetical protein